MHLRITGDFCITVFSPLWSILPLVSKLLPHIVHLHIPHHPPVKDTVPLIFYLLQLFLLAQPPISVQLLFEDSLLPPFEQLILLLQSLQSLSLIHI